jgi:hypothetical protein
MGRANACLEYYYQCRNCQQTHGIDYYLSYNRIFTDSHFSSLFLEISKYIREKSRNSQTGFVPTSSFHHLPLGFLL